MTTKKTSSADRLYKAFIYVALITLAVTIIIPVAWVFMASVKENSEFYGNPWALPAGFYIQNFADAWGKARMGEYMLNSVLVTALALAILLVVALPAAYALSRFEFRGRRFLNAAFMGGLFINVNYIVVPIFLMMRDWDSWINYFFGKTIFLNFWATWCPPCRQEMTRVQSDLIDRFEGRDFVFLPVSRGEDRAAVAAFREKQGYAFPMGLDPEQRIYDLYASNYIPRNFLIDADGKVVMATAGYEAEEFDALTATIERTLATEQ